MIRFKKLKIPNLDKYGGCKYIPYLRIYCLGLYFDIPLRLRVKSA